MRAAVLYAHPPESDGLSIQGHLLYKGLLERNHEVYPAHFSDNFQKRFYLKNLNLQVAYGIGYWGNVPDIVREPLKYNVTPIPWFNADGWVANYQEDFDALELMFTTSEWVRQIYKRDNVNINKIVPMHIGIDTNLFKPINNPEMNKKVRNMLKIKDNEKFILTIGGDVTSKGAQEMFKALAKIDKEYPNWKYVCKSWPSKGSEEWREKEIELVEKLGITDKVKFMDEEFANEFMVYLLNACDFYAAPSRIEGFGMIQVEAMACGKPVISINKMGPSETIIHKKTGFLAKVAEEVILDQEWVYPHMGFEEKKILKFDKPKVFGYRADPEELAEFSLKLLTDEELTDKMGKAAREHAVKNFDYKIIAKKIELL